MKTQPDHTTPEPDQTEYQCYECSLCGWQGSAWDLVVDHGPYGFYLDCPACAQRDAAGGAPSPQLWAEPSYVAEVAGEIVEEAGSFSVLLGRLDGIREAGEDICCWRLPATCLCVLTGDLPPRAVIIHGN